MKNLNKKDKALITKTVLKNKYIPHTPFLNQVHFLASKEEELLYGGQAGGGKSDALLMAALQYVSEEEYSALLLRRTMKDLNQPNAIMNRCGSWLYPFVDNKEVDWNGDTKTYTFPSGATLTFGYLSHDNHLDQYQGAEFQFVGFDELTQFTEHQYSYLHSRLRRLEDSVVPIRMRAGTNPGGRGHEWVKKKFVIPTAPIPFIPSAYTDNKYLDIEQYGQQLDKLDPVTRLQLKFGDWDAELEEGLLLSRTDLQNALISYEEYKNWIPSFNVIGIDKAGTGRDKFACCSLTYFTNEKIVLTNIRATDSAYPEEMVYDLIDEEYHRYKTFLVNFEGEPGSDSLYSLRHWTNILNPLINKYGIIVKDTRPLTSKFNRARPIAHSVRQGELLFDDNLPLNDLFNQFIYIHPSKTMMRDFPSPDELDALGYAFTEVKEATSAYVTIH